MIKRPLVFFGAAFLVTITAALFAPRLLLLITLPCGFLLLLLRGKPRSAALILSLGCLAAVAVSGLFLVRFNAALHMVGAVEQIEGSIFYSNNRQMAIATTDQEKRIVLELFPEIDGLQSGDGIVGTIKVDSVTMDSSSLLLSGGMLFSCTPQELNYSSTQPVPIQVRSVMLGEWLCQKLRSALPTVDTDTTVAILFSRKEYMSQELRSAFSGSGMSHLLAVSGLHLSILVWTLVGAAKHLGGGRWTQAIVGSIAALFVFLVAGMSPSVFRATIMILLTLLASLVSRKSDGLTSLSVAAVVILSVSPPAVANLSFILSFLSVGGILVLSTPIYTALERFWVSRFSRCGKVARWLLSAVSVSAAAQLATAPVVALQFGSLPLLGIVVNLVAIPLVYPVLIFGFTACLAVAIYPPAAAILLQPANLCTRLLGFIADITAGLPFSSLPTIFPTDLLPIAFLGIIAAAVYLFPHRIRMLRWVISICTLGAIITAGVNTFVAYNSITVASSSVTGSVIVTSRDGTVVVDHTSGKYHRTLDNGLISRLGASQPTILVTPHPYDTPKRIATAAQQYDTHQLYTAVQLSSPTQLLPDVQILVSQPYVTEITICNTNLMKCYAVYDTIEQLDSSGSDVLLVDRQGSLLSLGAKHFIFRKENGESFVRIYRNGG